MKKVAILTGYKKAISFNKAIYKEAAIIMKDIFSKNGIELVRVSNHHFNEAKNCFDEYVIINDKNEFVNIYEDYKPDAILKRIKVWNLYNNEILSGYAQVPSFKIIEIAKDKYEMSLFLKELQPKTFLLSTFYDEFEELSKQIWDKLVLKPVNWNSWDWIKFLSQKELLEQKEIYKDLSKMFIIQEFKDFSKWYNDLISWVHDVRLVYVWWNFSFSIVRQPAKWNLKSNIWAWWSQFSLSYESIPTELFELSKEAIKRLKATKLDIFSIDFAFCKDENKWYILEINCSPWVWFPESDREYQIKYFNDLCNLFNSI